ncbi:UNVERIFIED_CONTAM: hypothetical protein FKN15_007439 [Acipenser sinensis]
MSLPVFFSVLATMEYRSISCPQSSEEADTRCLTCWAVLDGSSLDGHQLFCGHWLCWTCLTFLRTEERDHTPVSICFRCQTPISLSPAFDRSPKPAFRWSAIFSSRKKGTFSTPGETSPELCATTTTTSSKLPQRQPGGFWRKLVQGPRKMYSRLEEGPSVLEEPIAIAKEKKRSYRLSLNLF